MSKRMTDERLAAVTKLVCAGVTFHTGGYILSHEGQRELLQALKAEREHIVELKAELKQLRLLVYSPDMENKDEM